MRVLLWQVPKLCCRPCWHFKGNIIPWCPWPLSAGPQIPPKIRPDQLESWTWRIFEVSGKLAKTVQGQLAMSQGEAGCTPSVRLYGLTLKVYLWPIFQLRLLISSLLIPLWDFQTRSPACCCWTSHPDRSHLINFINLADWKRGTHRQLHSTTKHFF